MITSIGVVLTLVGGILLYAAISGQNIVTEFRAAVGAS